MIGRGLGSIIGAVVGGNASLPTLAFASAISKAEGSSGNTAFNFTLNLTRNGSTAAIPYTWTVSGTGSNPANATDFLGGVLPTGSGTFAASETQKTITVQVVGDTTVEPDENFNVTVNASIPLVSTTGLGTILNDDIAPATRTQNIASAMRVPGYEQGRGGLSNGTDTAHNSLKWSINEAGVAVTSVSPVYVGWYLDSSGYAGEANNNGNLIVSCSIEYPVGTLTAVTFGGSATGTVTPGGQLIADAAPVSIPNGAMFGIRTYLTCDAGVKWNGAGRVAYSAPGIDLAESGASGTLANKTLSGTIAASAGNGYFPAAVLSTGSNFRKSYMVCGDSIAVGAGTAGWDANQNRGGIARGLSGKGAVIHAAVTGTNAGDQTVAFAGRLALAQAAGVTHGIVEYGSNDLAGLSVATVQANVLNLCTKFANVNIKPVGWTVLPRLPAQSADKQATVGTQVPYSTGNLTAGSGSGRAIYNDWIRSKPSPMFDYIEGADQFDVNSAGVLTRDGGYWRVGPTSNPAYLEGPINTVIQTGSSTTVVNTNSTKAANYFANYANGYIRFTSGALNGTLAAISTNTSGGAMTLITALSSAPAAGDTAILLSSRASSTSDGVHPTFGDLGGGDAYVRDHVAAKATGWATA